MSESVLAASDFSLETSWKQAEKGTLSPFECLSFANTIQADLPTCGVIFGTVLGPFWGYSGLLLVLLLKFEKLSTYGMCLWYIFELNLGLTALFIYCSYSAFYLQSDFLFYFSSFIFQTCSLQLCILVENSASVFNFSLRCYVNVIFSGLCVLY